MMYNYPYFGFPGYRKNPYHSFHNSSKSNQNNSGFSYKKPPTCSTPSNSTFSKDSNINNSNCNKNYNVNSNKIFNIDFNDDTINLLGLTLSSDDLLILTIIFFLYKEGSKDMYLYIALFMLLIS